jgi:surface antigen
MVHYLPSFTRSAGASLPFAVALLGASLLATGPAAAQYNQTFGTDQHACNQGMLSQVLSTSKGNLLGSAAGGALGGLLGNQLGKGSGNTLMTIAGVVGGALAGGYVGRNMDPTDQACVGQTLEHTPTAQTVAWQNPNSGSSYWVTPTQNYQAPNGDQCRNYISQAVINGQTQQIENTACRDANGAWRAVSQDQQASAAPTQQTYQPYAGSAAAQQRYAQPRYAQSQYAQPQYGQAQYGASDSRSTGTILKAQQRLRDLGFYQRGIDGVWGRGTMTAVGNFQQTKGLTRTSRLDDPTLAALDLAGSY